MSLHLHLCLFSSPSLSYDFYDLTRDSPNENETVVLRLQRLNQAAQRYARRAPNDLAGAPFSHPGEPSTVRRQRRRFHPLLRGRHVRLLPSRRALRIMRRKQSGMTMPHSPPLLT